MRNEQEIIRLKEELEKLAGFIGRFGTERELSDATFQFGCNVTVALDWVLEKTTTEKFTGDTYLFLERVKEITREIEGRTGEKFTGDN